MGVLILIHMFTLILTVVGCLLAHALYDLYKQTKNQNPY